MLWVSVALLGGLGALARFALDGVVSRRAGTAFPWGTLAVNLSGSVALGAAVGLALDGDALVLVDGALLGAYTTFSTWMQESQRLGEDGRPWLLWLNVVLSLLAGLAAVAAARAVAGLLP